MRAILLAAGMGTRLRPLTLTTPKSLTCVNGQPMLERQIEFLNERGINEIIIVTGYLKEKFEYLKEKYNVKIVYNDKFDKYNNIYTMYLVREYLNDCYVIDADVYLNKNFIDENINVSTYFSAYKTNFKNEWILQYDENNKVKDIKIGNGEGFILSGISYWSKSDGKKIIKNLEKVVNNNGFEDLYWDNIVKSNISDLDVYIRKIQSDDCYEIDSLEDLKLVEGIISKRKSYTKKY